MKYFLLSVIALSANAEWYHGHDGEYFHHPGHVTEDHYGHRSHHMHDEPHWSGYHQNQAAPVPSPAPVNF